MRIALATLILFVPLNAGAGEGAGGARLVADQAPDEGLVGSQATAGKPRDAAPACAASSAKVRVLSPSGRHHGRTHDELSQAWWQWAYSSPVCANPLLDDTGEHCAVGQQGPFWFLTGSFTQTADRDCSVPCDRTLFFPIVTCEWENVWVGQPVLTIDELRALCADVGLASVTLEIDGVPMAIDPARHRVQSSLFAYSLPPDNFAGQPAGTYFPVISDGIWVMLAPLPPGPHSLHFTAVTPGGFTQDIHYDLAVDPLELPCSSPPCP